MANQPFDPVAYINTPRWRSMSLGLERITELLARLGNPHQRLRFVHVAGTNGKGSTCAFIERILRAAGYRTGLFTSPYIVQFEERIRVNGNNIPLDDLRAVTLQVREIAEAMDDHPTEFELMTAVAFLYFVQQHCDIVVCEVGLGGRLDSTNVIETVEACVFAPISYDHCALLGSTLSEIAGEKAGILKAGVPAVSAPQEPEAQARLEQAVEECGIVITFVDPTLISGTNDDYSYGEFKHLTLALRASYQRTNAATALEVCKLLRARGWNISDAAIEEGLANASWPGRFEYLQRNPDVIVDGAHNIHAIRALATDLQALYGEGKVVFVLGVMADKDYSSMIEELVPLARAFVCYAPDNPRALAAESLAQTISSVAGALPVRACASAEEAVQTAIALAGQDAPLCFCGSLYGIAAIKQAWADRQPVRI